MHSTGFALSKPQSLVERLLIIHDVLAETGTRQGPRRRDENRVPRLLHGVQAALRAGALCRDLILFAIQCQKMLRKGKTRGAM